MNFKKKYYANKAGIVKPASEWHEQPHRAPDRYFLIGELAGNLAPYYINWPQRLPVVCRSIRGVDVTRPFATFNYRKWLEKVICNEVGLIEEDFFQKGLWVKYIDEYCSLLLKKNEDCQYVVYERIHDLISDDKELCASIHFLEAILCVSAYIRSESKY
jgi:hypothetical protein